MTESDPKKRPPVSLSKARHCRLELWLLGHGHEGEPILPGTQRTFDMGHLIEAAMLRGVTLVETDDEGGLLEKTIGPWWKDLGEVKDYATGKSFVASEGQLSDFQRPVKFAGFIGHMDALLSIDTGRYVLDTKSASGIGFDRAVTGNIYDDPFAREYVGQILAYREGLIEEGEDIAGAVLLYFNKEQSKICARFVEPNPDIVNEMRERLSWANNPAEPLPDYEWNVGQQIPLRCQYCSLRAECGKVRGRSAILSFDKKNKPIWTAA